MNADQSPTILSDLAVAASSQAEAAATTDWTASRVAARVTAILAGSAQRHVVRAPGRLDVMGGIADYTGALALTMTTEDHLLVGAQLRADGEVHIAILDDLNTEQVEHIRFTFDDLVCAADTRHPSEAADRALGDNHSVLSRCVFGALVELVRNKTLADSQDGLTIAVGSTMTGHTDCGLYGALAAGVLVVTTRATGGPVAWEQAAESCRRVENEWAGILSGGADAVCSLVGEPYNITPVRCDPFDCGASIQLPTDLALIGIDSGVAGDTATEKYHQVRTTTLMGCVLIDCIIRHDGTRLPDFNGKLARISVSDYVEMFRDRLPTKLKGKIFLDRFGQSPDVRLQIDPNAMYKIRSRCEHHIYENARAHQFGESLSRAIRLGDNGILEKTGELMYASHWSYGQRCGLGSVETDLLVNLIRQRGAEHDIFGAKVTGRGCGGVVVVLMKTSSRAKDALGGALEEYTNQTDRQVRLIEGSSPGALAVGDQNS